MDTELRKIAESLHPLERKLLPSITSTSLTDLSAKSGIPESEIMRPLQWLKEKGLVDIRESLTQTIVLGPNGRLYAEKGLPEKRIFNALEKEHQSESIKKLAVVNDGEYNSSLGILRKKGLIEIRPDAIRKIAPAHSFPEEEFLQKLPLALEGISESNRKFFHELRTRKDIVDTLIKRVFLVVITDLGEKLQKIKFDDIIDNITPDLLASGDWKDKSFRRYDITIPSSKIYGGRRHFVREAREYVKSIWLDLGFSEMTGSIVQTSFWNFDTLFTAQYHPVREMQDTFFIKEPSLGRLPDKHLLAAVRDAHEHGGNTGSTGWQYAWKEAEAKKNVLRTHTTPLSVQAISRLKTSDLPAKFFSVGDVFRNETVDWSHLFEFAQSEGIVVDEDANLRNLLGYLKEFFKKMGYDKIRARPAYFPYTEPSVEIDVFHPVHKKWVELGGSGIFRPEVTVPLLGRDVPVLAWGLGLGRILTNYYGITDIRDLYKNDLKQLREMKAWMQV